MNSNLSNKKVIFFDGDGTIWYPRKTKRSIAPHWIYSDKEIGENYLNHLVLTPSTLSVLKKLKELGKVLILISTHPHPPKKADVLVKKKVLHFKLENIFDEVYASREYPEAKGELMERILKEKGIPKSQALMIGDSYKYDYLSAKKSGIDMLFIASDYMSLKAKRIKKVISGLEDII